MPTDLDGQAVIQNLRSLPPARQIALIRSASSSIIELLDGVHAAVGLPKTDGRWSPAISSLLWDVLDRIDYKSKEAYYESTGV